MSGFSNEDFRDLLKRTHSGRTQAADGGFKAPPKRGEQFTFNADKKQDKSKQGEQDGKKGGSKQEESNK